MAGAMSSGSSSPCAQRVGRHIDHNGLVPRDDDLAGQAQAVFQVGVAQQVALDSVYGADRSL